MKAAARAGVFALVLVVAALAIQQARTVSAQKRGEQILRLAASARTPDRCNAKISVLAPQAGQKQQTAVLVANGQQPVWHVAGKGSYIAPSPMCPSRSSGAGRLDPDLILSNYEITWLKSGRRAGQPVEILLARPKRLAPRPTVMLEVEPTAGLILGISRISSEGKILSSWKAESLKDRSAAGETSAKNSARAGFGVVKQVSFSDIAEKTGLSPKPPGWKPDGFRLLTQGVFDCPCGCGRQFAASGYTDGLASFTVFQSRADLPLCKAATFSRGKAGHNCHPEKLYGMTVAGAKRGKVYGAVAGDLSGEEARGIVNSL